MKRIQDKVKDIVEVRPFRSIRDFTADPAETLGSYHFTDATADLMAKWLDAVAAVQPGSGGACALAGYRGVGKSHFLAALGALAASPDLRGRVSESHVEFSAQRLQRRHYPVSYLRRGTHATLLEELKVAVGQTFQIVGLDALGSIDAVIDAASKKSADTPWVLLIDTFLERGSRVTRDDGGNLSEIAEAARARNIFVGVALDDDIAGADGSNSAIVRSYSIDYLDQAHLYKVVNAHVFPKESQKQPLVHEIYGYFREVLPSFRWSEQKFASLYPLHPVILEVAPYVRLYVHDFALLGFASEAGEKILGRPANSLIALDEVYDNAEAGLRKIDDLQEAFAAYDKINTTVVNKIPVMQRLQAKLILKALLLLSLDGQGGTASEVCASELIFDESDPNKAVATVDELLRTFAEALPNDFRVVAEEGREPRYSFKVSSKENLNNALAEAVTKVPEAAVAGVLRRVFQERFPEAAGSENAIITELEWRGARRQGLIAWANDSADASAEIAGSHPWIDWEVIIDLDGKAAADTPKSDGIARVLWRPAALRHDEIDKLRSYYALSSNVELRDKYSEQIRASVHAHSIAAEKILTRAFLEDGDLVIDGFDYNFTEEARGARTLSGIFGTMLEPLFETRYPSHPYFTRALENEDVASIVTDVYNSTRRDLADVQSRAQTFAFPLGLMRLEGTSFVPESHERLGALPISQEVLELVQANGGKAVELSAVYSSLRKQPHGLGLAAQQMLLTALVAERYIEFVTTSGNRINQRSLDLTIIWDDILGVARPMESSFSAEKIKRWAKLFVKEGEFLSIDRPADREALTAAFGRWAAEWDEAAVLDRFQELPEDIFNVKIWRLSARASKTFGTVVETIRKAAEEAVAPEECLDRVAEAFSGSETEFMRGERELRTLAGFVKSVSLQEEARTYLAASEFTADDEIEGLRERLFTLIELASADADEDVNREMAYAWEKFRRAYADHFDSRHSAVMNSSERKSKFSDVLRSEDWAEFDILSKLPGFDRGLAATADKLVREMQQYECTSKAKKLLEKQPYCHCKFSLTSVEAAEILPVELTDTMRKGLESFRSGLSGKGSELSRSLEDLAKKSGDEEVVAACEGVKSSLKSGESVPRFDDLQLKILVEVLSEPPKQSSRPSRRAAGTAPKPVVDARLADLADETLLLNV